MSAKNLRIKPIRAADARAFIREHHYSGKVDPRSQLHLGVFFNDTLQGCLQFGPSIDKSRSVGLVEGTRWNGFIELHRLAFSDILPKNSESRAISVAMKMIKKNAPHIDWVLSYADATQCGDGTIYRASGFELIGIKKNNSMWRMPDGDVIAKIVLEPGFSPGSGKKSIKAKYGKTGTETSTAFLRQIGAECLPGFQIKYIFFINPEARSRLTVPVLPFSELAKHKANMYRGQRLEGVDSDTADFQSEENGASPISRLQND